MATSLTLRIKEVREIRGMSQDELAAVAGVRQGTISRLERGLSKSIDFAVLDRIARALRVDPALLLVRRGS